jgi:hypothetical protein
VSYEKPFLLSHWSGIDRACSQTDAFGTDTKLPYVRTADKEIRLAIVAPQGALHKLRYLEIPSGTLSNYALCISWAFIHLPKSISQILLGVKCISIIINRFSCLFGKKIRIKVYHQERVLIICCRAY